MSQKIMSFKSDKAAINTNSIFEAQLDFGPY